MKIETPSGDVTQGVCPECAGDGSPQPADLIGGKQIGKLVRAVFRCSEEHTFELTYVPAELIL